MERDEDACHEGKDSGGTKFGLAECGDMDQQLAQVASAMFGDIPLGLLDDIFQCIYFSDLLGVRRVCKDWCLAISRGSAPFQRNVVISMDFLRPNHRETRFHKFWLLVEEATTLIVCGEIGEGDPYFGMYFEHRITAICQLWDAYVCTERNIMSHRRINKVIYANMALYSSVFRCSAVLKVGFQTVLYHSQLRLDSGGIFEYVRGDAAIEDPLPVRCSFDFTVKVVGPDSHTLKEMEEYPTLAPVIYSNPVAEHFARMNCSHLNDDQLASMTDNRSWRSIKVFGSTEAVRKLIQQLINRFDPGNREALRLFDKGDLIGFAKGAHPLVSVLLYHFILYQAKMSML